MGLPAASESEDLSSKMEVDAFRRLFPLRYFERHLTESIRPDARPVGRARDTTVSLGAVASADGSALAKIGSTVNHVGCYQNGSHDPCPWRHQMRAA
ncbi:hypothetical protein Pint_17890 [Pistacia integerrima]|uniref:Uncharacterized protein n=1 Tax=Pistacia integerrima TaxID=434235 RepID=A0ACC0YXJ4_9ROSI|nr:hypothetical protein Pint_17890 [Pistacia integerrima]